MLPDKIVTTDVSNDLSIKELKELYITKLSEEMPKEAIDLEPTKIRFLCLGKELKDDLFVYSYDITDELTI